MNPRPLIIDEMDHIVKKSMVDLIRDIHDGARIPILMVGMETLLSDLRTWQQFHRRIIRATQALPADAADALKLRDVYCRPGLVSDDLADHFRASCGGVAGYITINLEQACVLAASAGKASIDRAWWAERPVFTGDFSVRRRAA